jgi:hypothetical protein
MARSRGDVSEKDATGQRIHPEDPSRAATEDGSMLLVNRSLGTFIVLAGTALAPAPQSSRSPWSKA